MATRAEIREKTTHQHSNIVARYHQGDTPLALAAEFELHLGTVYAVLRKSGVIFSRSKVNTERARDRAIKILHTRHNWRVDSLAAAFGLELNEMSRILLALNESVE